MKLKEWLKSDEAKGVVKAPVQQVITEKFFRDPLRHIHINRGAFYSPADGTILYTLPKVKANEPIINVKGKDITLKTLMQDDTFENPCLVIGIFLSFYDVHINRMPTFGLVCEAEKTRPLQSKLSSMIVVEKDLIGHARYNTDNSEYMIYNERAIVRIYDPAFDFYYYLVQIADREVDVICNWGVGDTLEQGERLGQIRYGSQVDVVIPLDQKNEFAIDILCEKLDHVTAGKDILLTYKRKNV